MSGSWPLTSCDLFMRYMWTGLTLGFAYQLDPSNLKKSLQGLLNVYSTLAGRMHQDRYGKYSIVEGDEVALEVTAYQSLRLADVPKRFLKRNVSDRTPDNMLLPEFLKQLQVEQVLAGKQALVSFQLTQLQDGCVLGVSLSHIIADAEALGALMMDLCAVYVGQPIPNRPQTRLQVQHFVASASGVLPESPTPSDEEIRATIPALEQPPASLEACIELGAYEILTMPASERATATHHDVQLLHVPDKCLDRLRSEIHQSAPRKQADIKGVSKHDITCALAWMIREAANGHDLNQGLQKNVTNVIGMRGNGCTVLKPVPYFGNAVCSTDIKPANVRALQTASTTHSLNNTLAAATCAVRLATEAFRADPNAAAKTSMAVVHSLVSADAWQQIMLQPELNPIRETSLCVTSWRNMYDKIDFGKGNPALILGASRPDNQFSVLSEGPYGDGVFCSMSFAEGSFEKLLSSDVLQRLAPEAVFVQS